MLNTPERKKEPNDCPTVDELFPLPGTNTTKAQNPKHEPTPLSESSIKEAREFFDWMGRNGILKVQLAAQTRKVDGKRGAPMGFGNGTKAVAPGAPMPSARAAELAQSLLTRLERMGKKNLELVTFAAEDSNGMSRAILLDDLKEPALARLKEIWDWQVCVLETSPENFQAILVTLEPMGREDRKSITDQLVAELGCDDGAKGRQQFHRLPGSVNYKWELAQPFVTRLHEFFRGRGLGVKPVKKIAPTPAPAKAAPSASPMPGVVRPLRQSKWATATDDPSKLAFRRAVDLLRSGAGESAVLAALSQPEVLRDHDQDDWPSRTLRAAIDFIERGAARREK